MLKLLYILPCLLTMFQPLNAKVDPPNYKFDLKTFDDFFPDRPVDILKKKFLENEVLSKQSDITTNKYLLKEKNYFLKVFTQERGNKVEDFFVRLPSYFLHDVFFQSLVNRYGKQKIYKKQNEEALYIWEDKDLKHVYSAVCTITCFPVFYSVEKISGANKSFLEKMK